MGWGYGLDLEFDGVAENVRVLNSGLANLARPAYFYSGPNYDVDGRVVAVEQAGGGNKAQRRCVIGLGLWGIQ